MNASDVEVKTRYEDLQMSIAEIAIDLGLAEDAVRMSLAQTSSAYRTEVRSGNGRESDVFDAMMERRAARVIGELLDCDDQAVRFRAAKFVVDERKGRNDAAVRGLRDIQQIGVSVLEINAAIKRAKESRLVKPVVEISSSSVTEKQTTAEQQLEVVLAK